MNTREYYLSLIPNKTTMYPPNYKKLILPSQSFQRQKYNQEFLRERMEERMRQEKYELMVLPEDEEFYEDY